MARALIDRNTLIDDTSMLALLFRQWKSAGLITLAGAVITLGISLLLPARPDFQQAVFALGKGSRIVYVIGRVAHCDRCADPQDGFVVGCRFLSKVDLPF